MKQRSPRRWKLPLTEERSGSSRSPDWNRANISWTKSGKVVHKVERNFPATLRPTCPTLDHRKKSKGWTRRPDSNELSTWHKIDEKNGPPGKYLVDAQGVPVYYVDPGINGTHRTTPDGSSVTKYDAPKATLMSYIIKGILNQQLPWGLVLLGVMIAIVLEMAGIPSLAFAVGVYLPLVIVQSDLHRRHGSLAGR